jgi:DHA2 family multidrug resistance protein
VAEQTPIQGNKLLITIAAMLGALMAVIDISIVNVALSDIRASFGTPLDRSPGCPPATRWPT